MKLVMNIERQDRGTWIGERAICLLRTKKRFPDFVMNVSYTYL